MARSTEPGTMRDNGEPWAAPDCPGCGGRATYVPGGGWAHRFIHCEVRIQQIAAYGRSKRSR